VRKNFFWSNEVKEGVYRKQKGRKEGCGPQAPYFVNCVLV